MPWWGKSAVGRTIKITLNTNQKLNLESIPFMMVIFKKRFNIWLILIIINVVFIGKFKSLHKLLVIMTATLAFCIRFTPGFSLPLKIVIEICNLPFQNTEWMDGIETVSKTSSYTAFNWTILLRFSLVANHMQGTSNSLQLLDIIFLTI